MRNWLLPEHIADILPATARQVESAKSAMLEVFRTAGYELVAPPMVEYLDSLVGEDDTALGMKTFKLIDQLSGRQLGLRADITPQVARIDAHLLSERQGVTRLCYAGSVVHARPDGLMSSREPLQVGAELYGFAGLEADREIIELMLEVLRGQQVQGLRLDLGHVVIVRALLAAAGLSGAAAREVCEALQGKDLTTLANLLEAVPAQLRNALLALPSLYGPASVLEKARRVLPALPEIDAALGQLEALQQALGDSVEVVFDLAELRADNYHTGLLFAVYAPGWSEALARGGRYDNVGQRFGRARPATGFSLDLRDLIRVLPESGAGLAIRVAGCDAERAKDEIRRLRAAGEIVVIDYLGEGAETIGCDRELVAENGSWNVVTLN